MWLRMLASHLARQAVEQQVRQAFTPAGRRGGKAAPNQQRAEPLVCEIAVAFALPIESGGLVDLLQDCLSERRPSCTCRMGKLDGRGIMIVETGVGNEAAGQAVADVIAADRPQWVISAGFAGGLHPDLRRGHILMADSVADTHGRSLAVGLHVSPSDVANSPSLHVGRLLTIDRIVRRPEEKRQLGQDHHALACDMESLAVAEACRQQRTRFLAVRVVSDAVDDELPPDLEKLLEQKSVAAKLGAATGALWQRPSRAKELWKLREQAMVASDRLARFLKSLVPQLPQGKGLVSEG